MKGMIFNLFEHFICDAFTEESWDKIIESSQLIHGNETYIPKAFADEDFKCLVVAANRELHLAVPDLLEMFGKYSFPHIMEKFPNYFKQASHCFDVIMRLDEIISKDMREALPNEYLPEVFIKPVEGNIIEIEYKSKRKLCEYLEGLIYGCAHHFKNNIQIHHHHCMHYGHDYCGLRIVKEI